MYYIFYAYTYIQIHFFDFVFECQFLCVFLDRTYILSLETTADDNITVTQIEFFNMSYDKESTFDVKYVGTETFADVVFINSVRFVFICI